MSPTPLPGSKDDRFSPRGVRVTLWIPAIAGFNASTPVITKAEIDAATDLTCAIQSFAGGDLTPNFIETPDQCSQIAGKIVDGISIADLSTTFYGDKGGEDASAFFSRGMTGYYAQAWYGLTEDLVMTVWPAEVATVSRGPELSGAQTVPVTFAPKGEPQEITIPSLV